MLVERLKQGEMLQRIDRLFMVKVLGKYLMKNSTM